jgi:hypothetical protein
MALACNFLVALVLLCLQEGSADVSLQLLARCLQNDKWLHGEAHS